MVLGSWGGMKKYLEQEMLADSLKGRVCFSCTHYAHTDGGHIFEVRVDGKAAKRFSMETVAKAALASGKTLDLLTIWEGWCRKDSIPLTERREFDENEFCEALRTYRALNIADALKNLHPVVRMFAILDRRVGKRTLKAIQSTLTEQPDWLKWFYRLRLDAENISIELNDLHNDSQL